MNGEITHVGEVLGVFTYIGERLNRPQFVRLVRPMKPTMVQYHYHSEWIADRLAIIEDDWS